jgi:uncharacterized protein (DUF58 family)
MPLLFDMNMVQAGVTAMPESDMEAARTRGAVSGDMIDIKEYLPGDPVRNIHWKLSEKTGKTLVKVLGNGEITAALEVTAHAFSASAVKKIEAAGGKAIVIE